MAKEQLRPTFGTERWNIEEQALEEVLDNMPEEYFDETADPTEMDRVVEYHPDEVSVPVYSDEALVALGGRGPVASNQESHDTPAASDVASPRQGRMPGTPVQQLFPHGLDEEMRRRGADPAPEGPEVKRARTSVLDDGEHTPPTCTQSTPSSSTRDRSISKCSSSTLGSTLLGGHTFFRVRGNPQGAEGLGEGDTLAQDTTRREAGLRRGFGEGMADVAEVRCRGHPQSRGVRLRSSTRRSRPTTGLTRLLPQQECGLPLAAGEAQGEAGVSWRLGPRSHYATTGRTNHDPPLLDGHLPDSGIDEGLVHVQRGRDGSIPTRRSKPGK